MGIERVHQNSLYDGLEPETVNPSRSYASTQGKLKRELNAYKIFFACQLQAQLSSWSAASARVLGCLGFLTGLLFLRSYGCLDLPTHTYTYIYMYMYISTFEFSDSFRYLQVQGFKSRLLQAVGF